MKIKNLDELIQEKYLEALGDLPKNITEMDIYLVYLEFGVVGRNFNYGVFCRGRSKEKGPFTKKYNYFDNIKAKSFEIAEGVAKRLKEVYKEKFNVDVNIKKGKEFPEEESPEQE